ncbi:immunity 49 family protein [Photobacterium sp. WH24]|uniref:Imm49 family immunity protein n=1 Tax=Photobacterium TaxID=657 RepID=UPI001C474E9E|nr:MULTISPECIES: Imm49 family immunity protein [Photobacterium]MBV7262612.1 immunity 49 family protein [Photobacterium sp. WH24]
MTQPKEATIREWITESNYQLSRIEQLAKEGFHQKHNIPQESVFHGRSEYYAELAICYALLGERKQSIDSLTQAIMNGVMPYRMAYDDQCELRHLSVGPEKSGCVNLALTHSLLLKIASLDDDALTRESVPFIQLMEKDMNDSKSMEMVNTVQALRNILTHGDDSLSKSLLQSALDNSLTHPIKGGWRARSYTLNLCLFTIVTRDQQSFEKALQMNLKDYEKGAKGEIRGTPEAYISLPAVGLVKLAKRYGLSYEGKHTLIPESLL